MLFWTSKKHHHKSSVSTNTKTYSNMKSSAWQTLSTQLSTFSLSLTIERFCSFNNTVKDLTKFETETRLIEYVVTEYFQWESVSDIKHFAYLLCVIDLSEHYMLTFHTVKYNQVTSYHFFWQIKVLFYVKSLVLIDSLFL
jgi:hypothetical protein